MNPIFLIFPYIRNVIIPTDELIFFRGVGQPPTSQLSPLGLADPGRPCTEAPWRTWVSENRWGIPRHLMNWGYNLVQPVTEGKPPICQGVRHFLVYSQWFVSFLPWWWEFFMFWPAQNRIFCWVYPRLWRCLQPQRSKMSLLVSSWGWKKIDHEAAAASLDSWDWGKYPPKGWTFRLSKFLQFVQMGSDSLCSKLSRPQWQPWHFQLQIAPFLEPHLFLNYQHLWKTISWKYWTLKHTLTKFGFWKHQTDHFFPPKFLWIQPHLKWGWFMAWRFTSLAYMEYVSSPKR